MSVIGKALFILFAIVLPLGAIGLFTWWLLLGLGGQGACFVAPLLLLYLGAMLVLFEAQRRRGMGEREEGNGESAVGNGDE